MLIVRSPLRISLAGGGTDLPVYYRKYGGMVINMALDRYFYVFLRTSSQNGIQIASADFQTYDRMSPELEESWRGGLKLPRAIFDHFGINSGISLFLASEAPPGTGLGSSSTVAVGLIKALGTACGLSMSKTELAELASFIEIEKLGAPIGKQDQYAAAFGGVNLIKFEAQDTTVMPLRLSSEKIQRLTQSLVLLYTGRNRSADEILSQQKEATQKKTGSTLEALHRVKEMVMRVKTVLEKGDMAALGFFLHQNWLEKKCFASGVTNPYIDKCYDLAMEKGAWGGKITGAGGGGFLLFCCQEDRQVAVVKALEAQGLQHVPFSMDQSGARVLVHAGLRLTSRYTWFPPIQLKRAV